MSTFCVLFGEMQIYKECFYLQLIAVSFSLSGVHGFSLSSSPLSEDGHTTVCPHANVTLTCTATQVVSLGWRIQDQRIYSFVPIPDLNEETTVVSPYYLTATITNHSESRADFISILEVAVDEIDNGTNITCEIFRRQSHLAIYKTGLPLPPSDVTVVTDDFTTENFSIILSWTKSQSADTYTISLNTTTDIVTTDMTMYSLYQEGAYNLPLQVNLSAVNCAGTSSEVIILVHEAGCSPPSPPVSGGVSEFTSSRVGAQVTYSCDTDLVLVGERVATCSEPSLQWLPSSEDIMCVQPPVCGDPSKSLPRHASISSINGSVVTFSCDPGYSLHGSTTSQCVSGEWTPSPETVMCIANQTTPNAPTISSPSSPSKSATSSLTLITPTPSRDPNGSSTSNSLNTSEAVAITAVVCGLCSFTAGLVLGLLLSRYCTYCHRTRKRVATDRPPVYEDITPEKGAGIELQHNEAYGHVSL